MAETGKPLEEMRSAYEEAYKAHQEERLIVRATKLDSQLKKNKIKAERIRKALEDLRAGNRPD